MEKLVPKNQYDLSGFDFTTSNDGFVRYGRWVRNTMLPIPYDENEDHIIKDMCDQGLITPEKAEKNL